MALGCSLARDVLHLGVEVLGILGQDAEPGGRGELSSAVVVGEPAPGLVGGQGVLLALAEGDNVEITHMTLKVAQPRVAMAHQLFVNRDGGT